MQYVVFRTSDYGDEPNFTKEEVAFLGLDHVTLPYVFKNKFDDREHTEFLPQYIVSLNTIDDLLSFQKRFLNYFQNLYQVVSCSLTSIVLQILLSFLMVLVRIMKLRFMMIGESNYGISSFVR